MIFPDVPVSLRRARALVLLDPRQVHARDKIANSDDPFCRNRTAVDGCHVPLGFVLDVGRRVLAARGNRAEGMSYSLPLDDSANIAPFPIAHKPAVPDADYLSVLLSHLSSPFSCVCGQLRPA